MLSNEVFSACSTLISYQREISLYKMEIIKIRPPPLRKAARTKYVMAPFPLLGGDSKGPGIRPVLLPRGYI